MGWCTDALIHVEFNRTTFNTKYDVESYIDDKKEELEIAQKTLQQLAFMTEPKKFCDEDADPTWWIQHELDEALETIETNSYLIGIAQSVLEGWDKSHHENGMAYDLPQDQFDQSQRVNGDFVKTCDKDGNPMVDEEDEFSRTLYNCSSVNTAASTESDETNQNEYEHNILPFDKIIK